MARHLPFDRYPFITTSNIVRLLSPLLNSSIQTPLIINTLNIVSLNFFPCGRLNFMLSLHSDSRLMSYFLDTPETSDTYEINTFLITPNRSFYSGLNKFISCVQSGSILYIEDNNDLSTLKRLG